MEFDSPRSSRAHIALLAAIRKAGLDEIAMRKLLWLVNAHPTLISHLQVFQHLLTHFESATFHLRNLGWAGNWTEEIPSWIRLCGWVVAKRSQLCRLHELALFDKKIKGSHPHLGHGVERHAVVASLWSRHESSANYPPVPNQASLASMRYFEMQGHLLSSYIDARFRLSSLEFYETYGDEPERPIAPGRTQEVGVAIREFSLTKYASVAHQLPSCESTPVFASELVNLKVTYVGLPEKTQDDAARYLISIRRYFDRFQKVLGGWEPPQTSKTGWGGGGGRARRHGFIHFEGPIGVFMQEPAEANSDPDIPCQSGQTVLIDLDHPSTGRTKAKELNALETSGLSPTETLEEVFQLYSPDEIQGRIYAAHHRKLAVEASAQAFVFDYQRLTPSEVTNIDKRANEWIACRLSNDPNNTRARQKIVAGLLARIMLLLGQPHYPAWSIGCTWQTDSQAALPTCNKLTLLIAAPFEGDWDNARILGFGMPAIMPSYKSELNQNLAEIDGDSTDTFVLPDLFGLGQQLIEHLKAESRLAFDGFSMNLETAVNELSDFTASFADPRITYQKISRFLSSLVTAQTGDQSLSWVLTADSRNCNQPRMHYTRHPVTRLQQAYVRAARRIQKMMGHPVVSAPVPSNEAFGPIYVGTRFVMSLPEAKQMLSRIITALREPLPLEPTQDDFRRYHNLYVIYTALFQALETSIRSVIGPNQLFHAWDRSHSDYGLICVGLSDKDSGYTERSRAIAIREPLAQQFAYFKRHLQCMHHHFKMAGPRLRTYGNRKPFFLISPEGELLDLTPALFEIALKKYTACDLPSNFHRAFLRTELLRRNCQVEPIDAHHGHANIGEISHSRASSFDYHLHFERIGAALQEIHDDIGLEPVPSHLAYQRLRGRPT